MKTIQSKIIITGILFLLIIITGIWLKKTGKPYKTGIVTLHKLIAITSIIILVTIILNLIKGIVLKQIELILIILSGSFFALSIATGAFLTIDKPINKTILTTHRITTYFALILSAFITILLLKI